MTLMEISSRLVNLMYFLLRSKHRKIKGSRCNKKWKLLTCFTNSLFKVYSNLSFKETGPEVYKWGLIWDPFYKEPKGRIDISETYTTWIVHRMN